MTKVWAFALVAALSLWSCHDDHHDEEHHADLSERSGAFDEALFSRINAYRAANGLAAIEFTEIAWQLSRSHSEYQAACGTVSHDHVDDRDKQLASQCPSFQGCRVENAAMCWGNDDIDKTVFEMWRGSEGHNANMLCSECRYGAVSGVQTAQGAWYFTLYFYAL